VYRQLLDPFRQGVPVGSAFVFTNRAANRVKVPDWGGRGLCLWCQRLEVGRSPFPSVTDGRLELTATQFTMILDGFDPLTARRR
jgi:transposase